MNAPVTEGEPAKESQAESDAEKIAAEWLRAVTTQGDSASAVPAAAGEPSKFI
jgi:hypothetical protein